MLYKLFLLLLLTSFWEAFIHVVFVYISSLYTIFASKFMMFCGPPPLSAWIPWTTGAWWSAYTVLFGTILSFLWWNSWPSNFERSRVDYVQRKHMLNIVNFSLQLLKRLSVEIYKKPLNIDFTGIFKLCVYILK